jgi:hypothetical protein
MMTDRTFQPLAELAPRVSGPSPEQVNRQREMLLEAIIGRRVVAGTADVTLGQMSGAPRRASGLSRVYKTLVATAASLLLIAGVVWIAEANRQANRRIAPIGKSFARGGKTSNAVDYSRAGDLSSVACFSASGCAAGADHLPGGLIESWKGAKWTPDRLTSLPGGASIVGLSCPSRSWCVAVGSTISVDASDLGDRPLAESWNGEQWSVDKTPRLPQAPGSPSCPDDASFCTNTAGASFSSVSCTSVSRCTAVGAFTSASGREEPLVEIWNGSSWSLASTSYPPGGGLSQFLGISCASYRSCLAVGYDSQAGHRQAFAESWLGSAWRLTALPPVPTGATSSWLNAVSCSSGSSCVAVGTYENPHGRMSTLTETWDGMSWSHELSPSPDSVHSSGGSELSSVACLSAVACMAVGYLTSGGVAGTLAEAWNGANWTVEATPNVTSGGSQLDSIACASLIACEAVGVHGGGQTLAERWNGELWAIQPTP